MVHMDSENKQLDTSQADYATATAKPTHDINNIILYPFAHQVST